MTVLTIRYYQFGRRIWDTVNVSWYAEYYTGQKASEVCSALNQMDAAHVTRNGVIGSLRPGWQTVKYAGFGTQNMMYPGAGL